MPDIMMCNDKECPSRKTCYRYLAIPAPFRQSYGLDLRKDALAEKCDKYWEIKEGMKIDATLTNDEF